MVALSVVDSVPAETLAQPSAGPARLLHVAVFSDRPLGGAAWRDRGLVTVQSAAARERLLANPPATLLIDLATATAQQAEFCWQLHDAFDLPVVALAEGAGGDAVTALFERGAADVITGEFDEEMVAAGITAVLRRRRAPAADGGQPSTLRLGATSVDLARREVRRADGTTRSLSRTEFALLLALVRARGRACGQHELIARVWSDNPASAGHYLRLYIKYLREKVEDDPRRPRHILNVWGRGYRLALGDATEAHAERPSPATTVTAGPRGMAWARVS